MKRNPFISRLATSVAAVALTIGSTFTFSACSDDEEVDNSGKQPVARLEAPVVAETPDENITENSLQFSWAAVKDATTYSAQIRLSEAGDIFRETITEATQVKFEGLDDGTKFYFRVRANYKYDESRNSAYSDWTAVETLKADPTKPTLGTPANPMCDMSKTTITSLTFAWESVEQAVRYNVVLTSIGKEDVTAMTEETSYTFTGLDKGTKYYFTVQAAEIEGYNASKFSGVISAVTTSQLATPQNLVFQDKMSQAVRFAWDAVENAATYGYELYTVTPNGDETIVKEGTLDNLEDVIIPGDPIYATATTNTSMTFRGLERDTYYAFRVKALPSDDSYLESEFTDYCVIKTLVTDATPLATPAISLDEAQQLKVMISWAPVANALGYDYQYATADLVAVGDETAYTSGELRATEADPANGVEAAPCPTTLTMRDLEPATAYKVRLMTIADPEKPTDGDSQWSEWFDVTTAELVDALTVSTAEELSEAFARMKDGGVITINPGNYYLNDGKNAAIEISLVKSVSLIGKEGDAAPRINLKGFTLKEATGTLDLIRFENLVLTGYTIDEATGEPKNNGYSTEKITGSGYVLDAKNGTGKVENLIIRNCKIYGFINALVRNEKTFQGFSNVTIENNIVCIGGDNGNIFDANAGKIKTVLRVANNTFDSFGVAFGGSKRAQLIRLPNVADCSLEVVNNTFYNIAAVGGKNLFESKQGTATITKNIVTLSPSITWTSAIGVSATLTSTDNFIFDTTSTLEGFTNADPGISGYVFLENYKPTNADVIAAGAGDPRWLK